MTDLILQIGASKLAISVVLGGAAAALTYCLRRPVVSHRLWLLLLAALLVPPLVSIPVFARGVEPATAIVFSVSSETPPTLAPVASFEAWLSDHWNTGLVLVWLFGAAGVVAWTLIRAFRFHRRLQTASVVASSEVQRMAREIAGTLGLASVPEIHATRAHVAPLVWWAGGRPRVLVPSVLLSELDGAEIRCILAHEFAHVRRRDHLVRWIEWLACSVFWWNPLAWWARRKLRVAEEFCCDALVTSCVPVEPRVYAGSLLRAIECMSRAPALRPPGFASPAAGGQRTTLLEERLRMIIKHRSTAAPRWLRGVSRVAAVCVLVASVVYCTDQADLTSVDAALAPAADDAPGDHAAVREILSAWLDSLSVDAGLTAEEDLDVIGPMLDFPWTRRVTSRILPHLDVLLAEGPEGPSTEAFGAALQGQRIHPGTPHYFVMLSRAGEGGQDETVVVDLARLRDEIVGTDTRVSQKDLEAIIRRSASMQRAGWIFKFMAGFSE